MKALLGFIFGLALCLGLTAIAGESPLHVFMVIVRSAFGTTYDLGLTLFYATSLVFTGLSVCVAFHAGLFNIGAEGQLTVATMAAVATGILWPQCPALLAPWMACLAAVLAGAIWGAIPGWLKAYRGSHEVVVTMMMNFIAAGVTSYFTLNVFRSLESQNPESQMVAPQFMFKSFDFIHPLFAGSPANISLVFAIAVACIVWFFLHRTVFGFELKMTGKNESAAELSGISAKKVKMLALTLAGALAGLVALNEVMGSSGKFRKGPQIWIWKLSLSLVILQKYYRL
jgi:general nucleoside transport system permease protein